MITLIDFPVVNSSWDHLKILSDSTRLRLLALLLKEELSVAELQEILGMAQSRISSQLALLRQAGFVSDRREGKKAFYSLRAGLDPKQLVLLRAACDAVAELPESGEDRESLDRVLQKRRRVSEQYFNLIAGKLGRNYCPGRSWEAIGHLALRLVPAITVADLGAGEGLISQLMAHRAERVWCIDNSERMVEVGTELARKNGLANLTYKLGDIEAATREHPGDHRNEPEREQRPTPAPHDATIPRSRTPIAIPGSIWRRASEKRAGPSPRATSRRTRRATRAR